MHLSKRRAVRLQRLREAEWNPKWSSAFFQENRGFKFTTGLCKGSEHHDCGIKVEAERTSWKCVKWRFTGKPKLWLKSCFKSDSILSRSSFQWRGRLAASAITAPNIAPQFRSTFFIFLIHSIFCNSHGFIINGLFLLLSNHCWHFAFCLHRCGKIWGLQSQWESWA